MLPGMSVDATPNPAVSSETEEPTAQAETPIGAPPTAKPAWLVPAVAAASGLLVGAGAVGVAWAASGTTEAKPVASASAPAASAFNLTGTMKLKQYSLDDGPCAGTGGYSDISDGTSVTVYDGGGQVVATGKLESGSRSGLACDFAVWVPDVPDGPKFYQVEVSHRGKLTLSAEDAKAGKFSASLG